MLAWLSFLCRCIALSAAVAFILELGKPGSVSATIPLGWVSGAMAGSVLVVLLLRQRHFPRRPSGIYVLMVGWAAAGTALIIFYLTRAWLDVGSAAVSALLAGGGSWLGLVQLGSIDNGPKRRYDANL